jgi:hypothetical protein
MTALPPPTAPRLPKLLNRLADATMPTFRARLFPAPNRR